jgi:glycosyltransferase involved in cell wall biosynthesis
MAALELHYGDAPAYPALRAAPLPKVAVIIPALDEEGTVGDVIASIPRSIPGVGLVEVILVDDGSSDRTQERAVAAGVDAICAHARPRGLVAAFKEGVHEALRRGASIVVNLDADGQHDPGFIPQLIAPIVAGTSDLVVGVRPLAESAGEMTTIRRQGNRVGSWVAGRALGLSLTDATSGYRAFSREALLRLNILSDYTYTLDTIIDASRKNLTVSEVSVPARRRLVGESRMTHSIVGYIRKTGSQAAAGMIRRRLPVVFGRLTTGSALLAVALTGLFLWRYQGGGAGRHLPALLASLVAWMVTVGFFVCAMLAAGIDTSRRLLEDALYAIRRLELGDADT